MKPSIAVSNRKSPPRAEHIMKPGQPVILILLALVATSAWAADRGYFGFSTSIESEGFSLNPMVKSVRVEVVTPNSPAAKAGIVPGDLIVEVEGKPVAGTKADVLKPYMQREVGQSTRIVIRKVSGENLALVLVAGPKIEGK
jgi:S1-C subfamily serine protease